MTVKIGGLIKSSFVDFPGHLAAVIFTKGCNFRCPYCHNPELVLPLSSSSKTVAQEQCTKAIEEWSESAILAFLKKRRQLLDGVVLCGGEPTLQKGLIPFLKKIKALGFKIKLDTNGSNPKLIKQALKEKLIDFIAMDFKAPLENYTVAAGVEVSKGQLKESIQSIRQSGLPYEFRTTAVKPLHTKKDLIKIGQTVSGAGRFVLQQFINGSLLNPDFSKIASAFGIAELEAIKKHLNADGVPCLIR